MIKALELPFRGVKIHYTVINRRMWVSAQDLLAVTRFDGLNKVPTKHRMELNSLVTAAGEHLKKQTFLSPSGFKEMLTVPQGMRDTLSQEEKGCISDLKQVLLKQREMLALSGDAREIRTARPYHRTPKSRVRGLLGRMWRVLTTRVVVRASIERKPL